MLVIGIDVGGTNTDAVLFDLNSKEIISTSKIPTSYEDLASSVRKSIENCLSDKSINKANVSFASIGTTHFLNAILQADNKSIQKVALIRLCLPATTSLPPFADFPEKLKSIIYGTYKLVNGGFEYDGVKEITEIKNEEILECCREIKKMSIRNLVISGVFSNINPIQERKAKSIIDEEFGKYFSITLSSDITPNIGLLERENAAILNASLRHAASRKVSSILKAIEEVNLTCDVYLTQNDGTLLSATDAAKFPIFTFNSGSTNTMRGAVFLTKEKNAIVIDIGGTSTDFGIINDNLPKGSGKLVHIADVRMNFQIPDVHSIGLGGGSLVKFTSELSEVNVGPKSVGSKLTNESICFGGNVLTATDIAVLKNRFTPTDLIESQFEKHISENFFQDYNTLADTCNMKIHLMVVEAIEHIKPENFNGKIILVGGGSILIDEKLITEILETRLKVKINILKPAYFDVANAIGAAITKVCAIIDSIHDLEKIKIEEIEGIVIKNSIDKGADEESIEIIYKSIVPISYIKGLNRVVIKAAGNLRSDFKSSSLETEEFYQSDYYCDVDEITENSAENKIKLNTELNSAVKNSAEWILNEKDLEYIAKGAEILGSGGGGVTYTGLLRAKQLLKSDKQFRVIKSENLKKNDVIVAVGAMGAPTVSCEKYSSNKELLYALEEMEKYIGKKITVLTVVEIGGSNSLEPLIFGAMCNLPVLDADCCGRAFPCLQMILPFMKKQPCTPFSVSDVKKNTLLLTNVANNNPKLVESILRAVTIELGCSLHVVCPPIDPSNVHEVTIQNSIEKAWIIGKSMINAINDRNISLVKCILDECKGKILYRGKVSHIHRYVEKGFTKGYLIVKSNTNEEHLKVSFQNEYLLAELISKDKSTIMATVPDIIAIIDEESESAVFTDEVIYGLQVTVLGLVVDPVLYTSEALEVIGPKAFDFDFDYKGLID